MRTKLSATHWECTHRELLATAEFFERKVPLISCRGGKLDPKAILDALVKKVIPTPLLLTAFTE
jgi:hypothetical protein